MRIAVGVLGVLLPLILVFGDQLAFHEDPFVRGSLSVYYFSGMRDEFVAILASTGIFLLTYKVAERNLDNAASLLSGFCAVLIALFPTGRPSYSATGLTRLQEWLGETSVKVVHIGASAGFLVALAVVSFFFGLREGQRPPRQGPRARILGGRGLAGIGASGRSVSPGRVQRENTRPGVQLDARPALQRNL